jgi:hypothetical protein
MPRLRKPPQTQQEELLLDACLLMKRYCTKIAEAAQGKPILDIACGTGRNAFPLAALGCIVICADKDLSRFRAPVGLADRLIPRTLDLIAEPWPFERSRAGGIVNVHFLLPSLLPHFETSIAKGGYLLLETVPGCGGNYVQLPQKGELRTVLRGAFDLECYTERPVGPEGCGAVTVQLLGRRI